MVCPCSCGLRAKYTNAIDPTKRSAPIMPKAFERAVSIRKNAETAKSQKFRRRRDQIKNAPTNGRKMSDKVCGPPPHRPRTVNLLGSQKVEKKRSAATSPCSENGVAGRTK